MNTKMVQPQLGTFNTVAPHEVTKFADYVSVDAMYRHVKYNRTD